MTIGRPAASRSARPPGLRAFRHRNYRLFFVGQLVSLIGTWMQTVAQAWLILQLTGNPFVLGLVAVVQFGPVLVLGPVRRRDRRRTCRSARRCASPRSSRWS